MKNQLLLLFFVLAATVLHAQEFEPDLQKHLKSLMEKQNETKRFSPLPEQSIPETKLLDPAKPGVYTLPQDGMPCVVPYTADIVAIPNAFSKRELPKLGQIPNATPKTGEELRRLQRQFFEPPSR